MYQKQHDEEMERMKKAPSISSFKMKYYGILFCCCLVLFSCLSLVHIVSGSSLICAADARDLYFNFFVFEGLWIRDLVFSFVQTGTFNPQLYSFNEGLGADIFCTTAGCFNDPLNLVSAIIPPAYAEYVFELLIFVRFFFSAVTFSMYSFSKKNAVGATLCGALCYVCCGFVVFWGIFAHPNFINVTVLFPLILLGSDKVFSNQSPLLFVIAMGFQFFISVYFAYMVCFALLGYCLIKCFFVIKVRSLRLFLKYFLKFLALLVVAFLLGSITAIPVIQNLTSLGRVGLERPVSLLFDFNYYWEFLYHLLGGYESQNAITIGSLPALCVLVLFVCRKKFNSKEQRAWVLGIVVCLIGALLPFIGHAMNGFGYVTDRWLFVLGFASAYAVTLVFSSDITIERSEKKAIIGIFGILLLFVFLFMCDERSVLSAAVFIFSLLNLVVFFISKKLTQDHVRTILWVLLIVLNTSVLACIYNSPLGSNFSEKFIKTGQAISTIQNLNFLDEDSLEIDDHYRIDRAFYYGVKNAGLVNKFNSMDFYSSYYNQNLDNFNTDLGLTGDYLNYRFNGYDERYSLNMLLGAKYYVAHNADKEMVPYSYDLKISNLKNGKYGLYDSSDALPIAYSCNNEISAKQYSQSNPVEKQELLTTGYFVSDSSGEKQALSTTNEEIEIVSTDGVRLEDGSFEVLKKDASIVFEVQGNDNCENYICFDKLKFQPNDYSSEIASLKQIWKKLKFYSDGFAKISVSDGEKEKTFTIVNSSAASYGGKVDFALNMGVSKEKVKKYVMHFSEKGSYKYEHIRVSYQPVNKIESNIEILKENNTVNFSLEKNEIVGSVDVLSGRNDCFMIISIPYSSGWSALVDGEPVNIERVNEAFLGIRILGEGQHEVELHYITPGLVPGVIGSGVGIICFAVLCILSRRNNKKEDTLE